MLSRRYAVVPTGYVPLLLVVGVDGLEQTLHSLVLRYVLGHACLLLVERYAALSCTHVAVVGIGHLAGAVHYAAYDAYLPVSYSHLTLPTKRIVWISVYTVSTKKKTKYVFIFK